MAGVAFLSRGIDRRRAVGRAVGAWVASLLLAVVGVVASPALASARLVPEGPIGPSANDFPSAYVQSLLRPGQLPPGVNNWTCKPSAAKPRPVVLIHGTWDNAYATWPMLSPKLAAEGYCVFAVNYGDDEEGWVGHVPGVYGTGDLSTSGQEVASFVDRVLSATGAEQVDLVGHSQGGLIARLVVQDQGGWDAYGSGRGKVKKVIGFGATNHGTTLAGIAALGRFIQNFGVPVLDVAQVPLGRAGIQQVVDSEQIRRLNAQGETRPGIDYTMIATAFDGITTPYQSAFLTAGPGATVRNVVVQDGCSRDFSEHLSMTFSPRALWLARAALDPTLPQREAAPCVPVAPLAGAVPAGSAASS